MGNVPWAKSKHTGHFAQKAKRSKGSEGGTLCFESNPRVLAFEVDFEQILVRVERRETPLTMLDHLKQQGSVIVRLLDLLDMLPSDWRRNQVRTWTI